MGGVNVIQELKNLTIGGKRISYNNGIENFEGFFGYDADTERAQLYGEVEKQLVRVMTYCGNIRRAKSRGCYKKLTATVKSYTDVMYGLANSGDVNALKKQFNKTTKKFKRMEEKEIMAGKGIIKEAEECVNSVIEASAVLGKFYVERQSFVENLNQSTEIANQILEVLRGCVDDSSKQSAQFAEEIMKQIYIWRNHASLYTCQSSDIKALQAALKTARELQKLPVNVNRLREAKTADIVKYDPEGVPQKILDDNPKLDVDATDGIETILNAPEAFEKLDNIKEAMNDYIYRGSYQRIQNIEAKIAEKKELIEKYQAEQFEVLALYKNGKLTKSAANEKAAALKTKINTLRREVYGSTITTESNGTQAKQTTYGLTGELKTLNKNVESRAAFINTIRVKIEDIEGYVDDLYYFSKFMNGINFNDAIKIFRGRDVTPEQINEVVENLEEVFIQRRTELETAGVFYRNAEQMRTIIEDATGVTNDNNVTVTEEVINEPHVEEIFNDGESEEVGNFSALDELERQFSETNDPMQDDGNDDIDLGRIGLTEDDR